MHTEFEALSFINFFRDTLDMYENEATLAWREDRFDKNSTHEILIQDGCLKIVNGR